MPDEIGGLPSHPLLIHLPLVLGPVVGLLTLLLLVPKFREKLLWPTAALGVVFAISAAVGWRSTVIVSASQAIRPCSANWPSQ